MITEEIKIRIDEIKDFLEEFSLNQMFMTTYTRQENKSKINENVKGIHENIGALNLKIDQILLDGIYSNFNFENWFNSVRDNSSFPEINPRLTYLEEQRELEKCKILDQKRKLAAQLEVEGLEGTKIKELREEQRKELKFIYYNGPEDKVKIQYLIDSGYDISDSIFPLSRMIERGRSMSFIQFLIQKGLRLIDQDLIAFNKCGFLDSKEFLETLNSSKNSELLKKFYLQQEMEVKNGQ